jgi:hypothetical protein
VGFDCTALELVADNAFTEQFMAALFLPHTDMAQFPSVGKVLEGQEDKIEQVTR